MVALDGHHGVRGRVALDVVHEAVTHSRCEVVQIVAARAGKGRGRQRVWMQKGNEPRRATRRGLAKEAGGGRRRRHSRPVAHVQHAVKRALARLGDQVVHAHIVGLLLRGECGKMGRWSEGEDAH